jgi:hypothetical protein
MESIDESVTEAVQSALELLLAHCGHVRDRV